MDKEFEESLDRSQERSQALTKQMGVLLDKGRSLLAQREAEMRAKYGRTADELRDAALEVLPPDLQQGLRDAMAEKLDAARAEVDREVRADLIRDAGGNTPKKPKPFSRGMERKSGAAIKAGFNIVGATQEFAQDSASADAFRAVYQKAVLGEHKLGDLFKHVMERFGEDHFERGAALLTKALAEDLAAATPSREPAKLNEILQDLYQLQTIKTVLLRCQNACKRLFNFSQISLQPFALAKELIGLASEKTVTSWGLRDIAKRLHVDDDEQIGAFMADLMSAIRIMPPKVFPSDEHRLRAIDAAQECLDIAELGGST